MTIYLLLLLVTGANGTPPTYAPPPATLPGAQAIFTGPSALTQCQAAGEGWYASGAAFGYNCEAITQ